MLTCSLYDILYMVMHMSYTVCQIIITYECFTLGVCTYFRVASLLYNACMYSLQLAHFPPAPEIDQGHTPSRKHSESIHSAHLTISPCTVYRTQCMSLHTCMRCQGDGLCISVVSLAASPYFVITRRGGRKVGSSRMCKFHTLH